MKPADRRKAELLKLKGRRLALLGLGLENRSLLDLLRREKIKADIVTRDAKQDPIGYSQGLEDFDFLFRSPGWPLSEPGLRRAARSPRVTVTSPLNLFLKLCPSRKIIGVTGSKGKGTTATLIQRILKDAGFRAWLGGNIGIAPLGFVHRIQPDDFVVLELSSFQLEDLKQSPRWAVITNIFHEHLAPADPHNPNYHASFAAYWRAKLNIASQPGNKHLIANQSLAKKIAAAGLSGRTTFFGPSPLPTRLAGGFNAENIGAAVALARLLKIPAASYQKTVKNFRNLEHRLEMVAEKKGVRYFDNSFATTPESTALDLQSFAAPIVLIAGGADKGADFRPLAEIIKQKTKRVIMLPGTGSDRLLAALQRAGFPPHRLRRVKSMPTAVQAAGKAAQPGDIVLLSAACASFGLFKNYKERGRLFQQYVREQKK